MNTSLFYRMGLSLSIFVLIIFIGFFRYLQTQHVIEAEFKSHFDKTVNDYANVFDKRFRIQLQNIRLLAEFLSAERLPSLEKYNKFSDIILKKYPEITAIDWVPLVLKQDKIAHELEMRALGFPDYHLTEITPDGLKSVSERPFYLPVTYLNPYKVNQKAHGFDTYSRKTNQHLIDQVLEGNDIAISPPVTLVQDLKGQKSVIVYMPVRDPNSHAVKGMALYVLRVNDFLVSMNGILSTPEDIDVALFDERGNKDEHTLFALKQADFPDKTAERHLMSPFEVSASADLHFANVNWQLTMTRNLNHSQDYLNQVEDNKKDFLLIVLFGFLLSLLVFFLMANFSKLTQANRRIKQDKERSDYILAQMSDIYALIDTQYNLVEVNNEACRVLGYTREELLTMKITDVTPKDSSLIGQLFKLPLGQKFVAEREYIRKDDSRFWAEISVIKVKINGEYFISGLARDLTEHRLQLKKLSALVDQAKEADMVKTEFLANMSHELRTPLHGILSFASMGESRVDKVSTDKLASYFNAIRLSGDRLLLLLTDLLDLSKLEAGKMQMEFGSYNLQSVLTNCLIEQESALEAKHIKVIRHGAEIPKMAEFDQNRLSQVIANFLSNAIKFTPENKQIELTCEQIEIEQVEYLTCAVKNQGEGIGQEDLKNIFDRFVQSKSHISGTGGTGLGLSICKEIIEAHQGKIWAESVQNEYAKFIFNIPIKSKVSADTTEV